LATSAHRIVRFAILLVFAGAVGLAVHRFRRTPDQVALARYVELLMPPILAAEAQVESALERLSATPSPTPAQARSLLIDDVIPRLVRLRQRSEDVRANAEPATRPLAISYLALVDQLIDACRACVRIIDDPTLPQGAGARLVHERFVDVRASRLRWEEELRRALTAHRITVTRPGS
jgi:hypothetical protein